MLLILACTTTSVKIDGPGSETGLEETGGGDTGGESGNPDESGDSGGESGGSTGGESGGDSGGESGGDTGGETGGDTGEPPREGPCSAWFPLDVEGARWVWSNGGSEITAEAAGLSRFGDVEAYRIDVSSSSFSASQYFACTEEGLAIVGYATGIEYATGYTITWDPPALYTPVDLTPESRWSTDTTLTVNQGGREESTDYTASGYGRGRETVEVAAGTFDTIRIALDVGLGYTADQYLAEGVGQVAGTVGELESYEIP